MKNNLIIKIGDGYFRAFAKTDGSKLQVVKDSNRVTYDIGTKTDIFPFQFGEGRYSLRLYEKVNGNRYRLAGYHDVTVSFKNEFSPYLYPNQYVRSDLSFLSQIDVQSVEDVKHHIERYVYDYIRAILVRPNVLPDIERCYKLRMGICQDLASLTVALLRRIRVPAKLIIGTANRKSHAWVQYYDDYWHIYDPTANVKKIRKSIEYSVERWY